MVPTLRLLRSKSQHWLHYSLNTRKRFQQAPKISSVQILSIIPSISSTVVPCVKAWRRNFHEIIDVIKPKMNKLQSACIVKPSFSHFASPIILVKNDGNWRNSSNILNLTRRRSKTHTLCRASKHIRHSNWCKIFHDLDQEMEYHQIKVHPDDRKRLVRNHTIWCSSDSRQHLPPSCAWL